MKYHMTETCLPCSFDELIAVFWHRYPNPYARHVLSEDVIYRNISNGVLNTKRLLVKSSRVPKWGEKLTSARTIPIIEESIFDSTSKTVTTYTRNVGLSRILSIDERCVYSVNSNGNGTLMKREAWINSNVFGLSFAIQKLALERYKSSVQGTDKGFIHKLVERFGQRLILEEHQAASVLKHKLDDELAKLRSINEIRMAHNVNKTNRRNDNIVD